MPGTTPPMQSKTNKRLRDELDTRQGERGEGTRKAKKVKPSVPQSPPPQKDATPSHDDIVKPVAQPHTVAAVKDAGHAPVSTQSHASIDQGSIKQAHLSDDSLSSANEDTGPGSSLLDGASTKQTPFSKIEYGRESLQGRASFDVPTQDLNSTTASTRTSVREVVRQDAAQVNEEANPRLHKPAHNVKELLARIRELEKANQDLRSGIEKLEGENAELRAKKMNKFGAVTCAMLVWLTETSSGGDEARPHFLCDYNLLQSDELYIVVISCQGIDGKGMPDDLIAKHKAKCLRHVSEDEYDAPGADRNTTFAMRTVTATASWPPLPDETFVDASYDVETRAFSEIKRVDCNFKMADGARRKLYGLVDNAHPGMHAAMKYYDEHGRFDEDQTAREVWAIEEGLRRTETDQQQLARQAEYEKAGQP